MLLRSGFNVAWPSMQGPTLDVMKDFPFTRNLEFILEMTSGGQRCSFLKLFLPMEHTISTSKEPHPNTTLDRQAPSLGDGNSFLS